ncbi:MAG: hypothetical protein U0263_15105 [Polyangiaceae bacterium]
MSETPKRSPWLIVGLVVGGVLLFGVVIVGILAALGIAGFRGYLSAAKGAEGRSEAYRLAQGIARCAENGGPSGTASGAVLPPTAPPVPSNLAQVAGKKYASSTSDWSDPAYTCASFSLPMPQYFQYRWELVSPNNGRAIARADLDGDGKVDQEFTAEVTCTSTTCSAVPPPSVR